jgi:hypothetical protein
LTHTLFEIYFAFSDAAATRSALSLKVQPLHAFVMQHFLGKFGSELLASVQMASLCHSLLQLAPPQRIQNSNNRGDGVGGDDADLILPLMTPTTTTLDDVAAAIEGRKKAPTSSSSSLSSSSSSSPPPLWQSNPFADARLRLFAAHLHLYSDAPSTPTQLQMSLFALKQCRKGMMHHLPAAYAQSLLDKRHTAAQTAKANAAAAFNADSGVISGVGGLGGGGVVGGGRFSSMYTPGGENRAAAAAAASARALRELADINRRRRILGMTRNTCDGDDDTDDTDDDDNDGDGNGINVVHCSGAAARRKAHAKRRLRCARADAIAAADAAVANAKRAKRGIKITRGSGDKDDDDEDDDDDDEGDNDDDDKDDGDDSSSASAASDDGYASASSAVSSSSSASSSASSSSSSVWSRRSKKRTAALLSALSLTPTGELGLFSFFFVWYVACVYSAGCGVRI